MLFFPAWRPARIEAQTKTKHRPENRTKTNTKSKTRYKRLAKQASQVRGAKRRTPGTATTTRTYSGAAVMHHSLGHVAPCVAESRLENAAWEVSRRPYREVNHEENQRKVRGARQSPSDTFGRVLHLHPSCWRLASATRCYSGCMQPGSAGIGPTMFALRQTQLLFPQAPKCQNQRRPQTETTFSSGSTECAICVPSRNSA